MHFFQLAISLHQLTQQPLASLQVVRNGGRFKHVAGCNGFLKKRKRGHRRADKKVEKISAAHNIQRKQKRRPTRLGIDRLSLFR